MSSIIRICMIFLAFHVFLCNGEKNKGEEWWEYGHFYHILTRSFQDSNGDGIGDLNGIASRLSYLHDIGVDGVWLSPINPSPLKDMGYDISDYLDIHSEYGKMKDFERLIKRCKEFDIKLLLDFVPNHTSDQHIWFQISSNPNHRQFEKYKNYYIWNEGKVLPNGTRVEPNNWRSIFKSIGKAWTWVESRKAYYFHQFLRAQPDLNYRNPAVVKEMDEILRFWLRKGVAGFRVDAVAYLMEAEINEMNSYDEPLCDDDPEETKRIYTKNLDESYDLVCHFHDVVKEKKFSDFPRILMTEAYTSLGGMIDYYGKVENGVITRYGAEIPLNFEMQVNTRLQSSAREIKEIIDNCIGFLPRGDKIHPNWVLGNHDSLRLATKYGEKRTDLLNMLIKTLPGITITYYGEELGMTDAAISDTDLSDFLDRDRCRTPMQWDATMNAGFSTAEKTWLPLATNYDQVNVVVQKSTNRSHLNVFQKLSQLRKSRVLKYGALTVVAVTESVLAYKRQINGDSDVIVVILNIGSLRRTVDVNVALNGLPDQMETYVSSVHFQIDDMVDTRSIVMQPKTGLVLIGKECIKSEYKSGSTSTSASTSKSKSKSKSWFFK